jgi:hypothetical protein
MCASEAVELPLYNEYTPAFALFFGAMFNGVLINCGHKKIYDSRSGGCTCARK